MKLRAQSYYNGDTNTRFGDCILLYDKKSLVVYDCGHEKHAESVMKVLKSMSSIAQVHIVVSHNDGDHTNGIIDLLEHLHEDDYAVMVYSSLYLKSVRKVLGLMDDGRRTKGATIKKILDTFDKIKDIVEKAQEYNFDVKDAKIDTDVASCKIVGPTEDEFVAVVAKAIEDGDASQIDGETVMNAASVQLRCPLDDGSDALLCGDASPEYLPDLSEYRVVQLPHHGKLESAEKVFDSINHDSLGEYTFLVSDNTGNSNAGSDDFESSPIRIGKVVKNTKDGEPVEIGAKKVYATIQTARQNHGLGYEVVR